MQPISKGEGEPSYTLYIPFWTPHNSRFTVTALIPHLQSTLSVEWTLGTREGRGREILRIQGFLTREAAKTTFERILSISRMLSLESNTAIVIEGEVRDPSPRFLSFPEGLPYEGCAWKPDPETGRIRIDGIVNILVPTIVPEHKRIVDAGGRVAQIQRETKPENVRAVVASRFPRHSSSCRTPMSSRCRRT
jgi:hypothetical protein